MAELRTEGAHAASSDDFPVASLSTEVPITPTTRATPAASVGPMPGTGTKTYEERIREVQDELIVLREQAMMQSPYRAARQRESVIRRRLLRVFLIIIIALLSLQMLLLLGAMMGASDGVILP